MSNPSADKAVMNEVKDLIAFYEARGSNWLSAAEFTLAKYSGTFDALIRGPIRTRIGVGLGRPRREKASR